MEHLYRVWIDEYAKRHDGQLAAQCAQATQEMVCVFPELRRVAGYALTLQGKRAHWWCETPAGDVSDPTADQFAYGVAEYIEWHPGDEVCVGKCMNCGEEIWRAVRSLDGSRVEICRDACREALQQAFNASACRPPRALDVLEEPLT